MNVKQIREILKLFEQSSLQSLEVSEGEERICLRRPEVPVVAVTPPPAPVAAPAVPPPPVAAEAPAPESEGPDFNRLIEVKSPVVGVFYEAAEPGGKPFVQTGDRVKQGDVLCLVEVMKQVTEVVAPKDAQVADVCVTNGSVVEFGQTLVKLY